MNAFGSKLQIEHIDKKLAFFNPVKKIDPPQKGWIYAIRTSIKMSLRQLAGRLNVTPQSVKEIEEREATGSITIRSLTQVANALDMKFVYGFVPKDGSIEKMIEKRAEEIAREIVLRTSATMKLEDQENSKERLEKAIENKAAELGSTLPKYLWD